MEQPNAMVIILGCLIGSKKVTWYLNKKDTPCYQCPDRHMGCHGKCEKYERFREENEKRKAAAYADKEINEALRECTRKQARRSGKYLRNVYF